MRRTGWAAPRLALLYFFLLLVPLSPSGSRGRVLASGTGHSNVITWMRVVPAHPRLLYAGGYSYLPVFPGTGGPACVRQLSVSANAGTTWQRLPNTGVIDLRDPIQNTPCSPSAPVVVAADGVNIFRISSPINCHSVYSCGNGLLHSADAGRTWSAPLEHLGGPSDTISNESGPWLSFATPGRAYAIVTFSPPMGGSYNQAIARSDDAGSHWHAVADLSTKVDGPYVANLGFFAETLADPAAKDTVYAGLTTYDIPLTSRWMRSEDGGHTWHRLRLPVDPGPQPGPSVPWANYPGLLLSVDPHLPGAIVLSTVKVPGVPTDRRWASLNRGTTWRQTVCPGDLRGACPFYALDNVFRAGQAYSFYADGVHAFEGGGLAGPRLALSDRLPCRGADVLDVGGGVRSGDPAYLLCQVPLAARDVRALPGNADTSRVGALYRSANGGASWQRMDPTAGW